MIFKSKRKKMVLNLQKLTTKELCEIYEELNSFKWDLRLGKKPKNWEELPAYRIFFKSKYGILNPIQLAIGYIVGEKELLRHHHLYYLGRTEEEFQSWYNTIFKPR